MLKGQKAVDAGFRDRQAALQPGEIRSLRLPLPVDVDGSSDIRVRLRFRNLPREFLEGLAKKFEEPRLDPGDAIVGENANAQRCRDLLKGLKIFEMASSTFGSGR